MSKLNAEYWDNRYLEQNFPWDLGHPSRPLVSYFDNITDKSIKILVPGGGNGHEASWLYTSGFNQVDILDWAPGVIKGFLERNPDFPEKQAICVDFFEHQGQYDLILEQTFFCALDPSLRRAYCEKMLDLLKPEGILTGVLFEFALKDEGPPFGGLREQYLSLFSDFFEVLRLEPCTVSEPERMGHELLIELKPKP